MYVAANVSEELNTSFKVVQMSSRRHIPEDWNVNSHAVSADDSSVGIATRYGLEGLGIKSR